MKRLSMILLGILTIPAYGGIASQEYVDNELGKVSDAIDKKANKTGYTANMLLQTANDGKLTATTLKTGMIESGAITNSKLASGIGLDKLDMGDLPTSGKHIMIWNSATNKYVFEAFVEPAAGLQCPAGQYDIGFSQCIDPTIAGTTYTYDATAMTWKTVFPYGNVSGVAVCNDTSGSWGGSTTEEMHETGGVMCWCKMTHPAVSLWVFHDAFSSSSGCAGSCALRCGLYVRNYSSFRSRVFSSVGN